MFIKYPHKIHIYKVKPWCIYFKYEDKHYMVHTSSITKRGLCYSMYSNCLHKRNEKHSNVDERRIIMWIRSQDKKQLVNENDFYISLKMK